LWDTKTEQLSYALDIQKRFSTSLMKDVSIARFIADFGQMVNTPIILLNPFKTGNCSFQAFYHEC
jgi:purine catabolism regulator